MKITLFEYNIQQPVEKEITSITLFNSIVEIANQQHDSDPLIDNLAKANVQLWRP